MCRYCNQDFYIKTTQFLAPLTAPLTREQELRDELVNLTGEVYLPIPISFCPICGEKIEKVSNSQKEKRNFLMCKR